MATILVTDDYNVTRRVMGHILEHYGYTVLAATHGLEALDVLEQHHVDLLLLDINMPEMDGLTLLQTLRGSPEFAALPVIILTASGQDEDRYQAEQLGANGFLNKPTGSAELVQAVETVLGQMNLE